mmetsp:Transcript_5766/g.11442  ORF Transcript_5766/g.11442 Transcript_5766/m.11442 type:complete len:97 (-) Transcript_5766:47-337(-)
MQHLGDRLASPIPPQLDSTSSSGLLFAKSRSTVESFLPHWHMPALDKTGFGGTSRSRSIANGPGHHSEPDCIASHYKSAVSNPAIHNLVPDQQNPT